MTKPTTPQLITLFFGAVLIFAMGLCPPWGDVR